jgi:hypothetical protein
MKNLLAVVAAAFVLNGCAAVGVMVAGSAAGIGMGASVEHTLSGITYKTFAASVDDTRQATLATFGRMAMTVTADAKTEDGWKVSAAAAQRTIDVELEQLTPATTRMRVVANKGDIFFKDASTATEIILQTAQSLDDLKAKAAAAPAPVAPAKATSKTSATKTPANGGKRT